MRCPSCGFVSFDHLTTCKKCGKELPPPPAGRRIPTPVAGPPPTGRPPAAPGHGGERGTETVLLGPGAPRPAAPSTPEPGEESLRFTLPEAVTAPSGRGYDGAAEADFAFDFRPAGFWIRFVASVVDGILLLILTVLISIPFGLGRLTIDPAHPEVMVMAIAQYLSTVGLLNTLVSMLYSVIFVGRRGQTPGKILLRLKIIRTDGGDVDYVKAFIRWIGQFISAVILMIGFIMAAFTTNKRALHDYIAGTRVIRL